MFKNLKRSTLNFWIDSVAFVGFIFMISTGFILRYVLPPGSGRTLGSGSGVRAMEKSIDLLWGFSRHEWGNIHFWISMIFLAVLAFHLILHWRWIVCMMKGEKNEYSGARFMLGIVGLLTIVMTAVGPFLSEKTKVKRSQLIENSKEVASSSTVSEENELVKGSMTIAEASALSGVPIEVLVKELGMPSGINPSERLGKLRRTYGFEMGDVKRIVENYKKDHK